ncbi:hypothetical protein OS493_019772 [Desmophyllum pertusum]|uniref:Uncharacterized protein n=1 Tax=Desmophyllum pertusum TaxID=174260 RepID=A0A9X0CQI0_9CNID|nr:hypothetical protein OS493_019772 [Desmophyllum pertusum]
MLKTYLNSSKNDNDKEEMDVSLDISMQSADNDEEGNDTDKSKLEGNHFLQGSVSSRQAEFLLGKTGSKINAVLKEE